MLVLKIGHLKSVKANRHTFPHIYLFNIKCFLCTKSFTHAHPANTKHIAHCYGMCYGKDDAQRRLKSLSEHRNWRKLSNPPSVVCLIRFHVMFTENESDNTYNSLATTISHLWFRLNTFIIGKPEKISSKFSGRFFLREKMCLKF